MTCRWSLSLYRRTSKYVPRPEPLLIFRFTEVFDKFLNDPESGVDTAFCQLWRQELQGLWERFNPTWTYVHFPGRTSVSASPCSLKLSPRPVHYPTNGQPPSLKGSKIFWWSLLGCRKVVNPAPRSRFFFICPYEPFVVVFVFRYFLCSRLPRSFPEIHSPCCSESELKSSQAPVNAAL